MSDTNIKKAVADGRASLATARTSRGEDAVGQVSRRRRLP
jgi:hypothetical protein